LIDKRDFLEKKMKFVINGVHFIYFSSIPDQYYEIGEGISRAITILGFHVYEIIPNNEGGAATIKFTALMQSDFNLKGPMAGIAKAAALNSLPKNLKGWYEDLVVYLKSNPIKSLK